MALTNDRTIYNGFCEHCTEWTDSYESHVRCKDCGRDIPAADIERWEEKEYGPCYEPYDDDVLMDGGGR